MGHSTSCPDISIEYASCPVYIYLQDAHNNQFGIWKAEDWIMLVRIDKVSKGVSPVQPQRQQDIHSAFAAPNAVAV